MRRLAARRFGARRQRIFPRGAMTLPCAARSIPRLSSGPLVVGLAGDHDDTLRYSREAPAKGYWAQPDPPLSPASPVRAVHAGARSATIRPLTLTFIFSMRLTWPFLSRFAIDCVYETLSACE
jgi:hypothetical protein